MHRFTRVLVVPSFVLALGAACGGDDEEPSTTVVEGAADSSSPAAAGDEEVSIEGNAYDPEELIVTRGTEIRWVNADGATHTVTADDGSFASENLAEGDEFTFTFDDAGEFTYTCEIHPFMEGIVTVE